MVYEIGYAPIALIEFDEILSYIEEKSPQGALRVKACIQATVDTLRYFPHTGTLADSETPPLRRVLARQYPYAIFYEVSGSEVVIIGIRHTARDPASMPGR